MEFLVQLSTETNRLLASANYTAAIILSILCGYLIYLVFAKGIFDNKETSIKQMMIGAIFESGGWAIHRWLYAGLNHVEEKIKKLDFLRLTQPVDEELYKTLTDLIDFFVVNNYIMLFPMWLVLIGLSLIVSPLLATNFDMENVNPKRTFFISLGLIFGTFWFIFWSI